MQIFNETSSSSSFTPSVTENFQAPSTQFYESSCKEMSCNQKPVPCCISNFFKKIGTIIAYPFVKLYQAILALIGKKTAESSEKPDSRHSSKEQQGAHSVASSEHDSIEAADVDLTHYDDKIFDSDYFYAKGVQGFHNYELLDSSITDEAERRQAHNALGWNQDLVFAWNEGSAFHMGLNGEPLPQQWANNSVYEDAHARGKAAARKSELKAPDPTLTTPINFNPASYAFITEDLIYRCGQNGMKTEAELARYLELDTRILTSLLASNTNLKQKWAQGICYHFGAGGYIFPSHLTLINHSTEEDAAYEQGKKTLNDDYENDRYLQPERFTENYFYEAGKKGLNTMEMVVAKIPDLPGQRAAENALDTHENTFALRRGYAFFCGKQDLKLPTKLRLSRDDVKYQEEYLKGKEARERARA